MRVVAYVAALMLSLFGCEEAPPRSDAAATQAMPSPAAAGITVLNETNTALSMQFTDAQENTEVFNFSRPDVNAVWKSADPSAGRGIRFGNDAPVFASVRFLASRDIPLLCSAVTLDSSIAETTMEDITVFELTSGTVVVGLWNHEKITHIAWVGSLIQEARDMMEQGLFDLTPVCDAAAPCRFPDRLKGTLFRRTRTGVNSP